MKTTPLVGLILILICCQSLIGCDSSGSKRGSPSPTTTVQYSTTPLSNCNQGSNWDTQRECLVLGYRADIDRCYIEQEIWRRNQCVLWVQNQYNLRDNTFTQYWTETYDRLTDPFYYQWAEYQVVFQNLLAYNDPWQMYWQQAYQQSVYYNSLYWNWYRQLYGYYWLAY